MYKTISISAEDGLNPSMVFEFMPFGDLVGVLRSNSPSIRQPIEGLPPLDRKHLLIIALQVKSIIPHAKLITKRLE